MGAIIGPPTQEALQGQFDSVCTQGVDYPADAGGAVTNLLNGANSPGAQVDLFPISPGRVTDEATGNGRFGAKVGGPVP